MDDTPTPAAVRSARNLLSIVRQEQDAIIVAMSFGKDSWATLDLCIQTFSRVEAFYLTRVLGLECVADWCDAVKRRYGISVLVLPHWDLSRRFRHAVLQPHWRDHPRPPRVSARDVEEYVRTVFSVRWIAYGWRRNDSMARSGAAIRTRIVSTRSTPGGDRMLWRI